MNRTLLSALVLGAAIGAGAGCDDSAKRQRQEANEAVSEAEATARQARIEADKKIAEARHEAAEEVNEAQRKAADERADLRDGAHKRIAAIDRQIDDLKLQSERATGKLKDDVDRTLTDARARRAAVEGEMRAFEADANREMKPFRSRLDTELDELESLLRRGVLRRD